MSYNFFEVQESGRVSGFSWDDQLMEFLEDSNAYDVFINWDGGMIYLDESTVELGREKLQGDSLEMLEVLEAARVESGVDILKVVVE